MGRTFSVEEINTRVRNTIQSRHPVIGVSASSGLVGKASEAGGADFIVLYSTGRSRVMGQGTRLIGDANTVTYNMHEELWAVVDDTPIIVGVDANDIFNWDLHKLLKKFQAVGVSGIIHNPMIGIYGGEYVKIRTAIGHGFDREILLTEMAKDMGMYCMAYTWTKEETVAMTKAGSHCIIPHVGGTGGGLTAIPHKSVEDCVKIINSLIATAKSVNPDVLCLAHGGPFKDPESVLDIYRYTDAQGYIGASSVERTPVENAVMGAVKAFKSVPLRRM
ncbi:phosphoenolpyruvate hydrolase family protein [Petroclostridium sp. X23]|uniref:phosphoenolpyruvate hydrolase family protein n=1 Tax=Petroclostridium sp. X23 TaxID=3045146 RepID=UPI0024ADC34D|nr:phosphoenolpyruvate hydrolase family protein [Petroclostridium sp. X23]WHH60916.1 phosphoenolpyruvate hydrolase family protein [Petroclostridium sp. X23]